jgi:uncharacterized membrane protein
MKINFRAHWQRWVSLILAVLGILVASYLTWVKLSNQIAFCSGVGDCESVNNSPYAEINGIPVAALGLGAYVLIAVLLLLENRVAVLQRYGPLAVFGLSLTGALYSAYLTYLELFVIHAICPYCVMSAILIAVILILSVLRVLGNAGEAEA